MTTSEQIRVLCVRSGVSLSELARRINQTPQNFSVKLKRNTVTQDELLFFLMSSNNCNSFSLFNPLTRADGLYFLITLLMLATLMVVDPEYELKGSSTSE